MNASRPVNDDMTGGAARGGGKSPLPVVFLFVLRALISLACLGVAGVLAWRGTEGWGWFLLIAWFACPKGFSLTVDGEVAEDEDE